MKALSLLFWVVDFQLMFVNYVFNEQSWVFKEVDGFKQVQLISLDSDFQKMERV